MGIIRDDGRTVKPIDLTSQSSIDIKTVSQRSVAGDKASLEDAIASANMEYYKTNLTTLLNSPTLIIDLLPLNKDYSSFRSGTFDTAGANRGGIKFNLIRNFVVYHEPNNLISDSGKDDDKNIVVNTNQLSFIVLPSIDPPLPGSRLVRKFENKSVVYEVISTEAITYQDHPFYRIVYAVDSVFKNKEELIPLIIDKFDFVLENVGSGNNPVIKDDVRNTIENLKEIAIELDATYNDSFYSSRYDNVVFIDRNGFGEPAVYTCPAMALFQTKYGPLTFRLVNTLMILPARKLPREKIDYGRSMYNKIVKKDLSEGFQLPPYAKPRPNRTLINVINESVEQNEFDNDDITYEIKYNYTFDLFGVNDKKDKVLTPFRSIMGELHHIRFLTTEYGPLYESAVQYSPSNKRLLRILDTYISGDKDAMPTVLETIRGFEVDEDNFDHFMLLPIIILLIKEYVASLIKLDKEGEWS